MNMSIRGTLKPLLVALAAGMAIIGYSGGAYADDTQDNAALKEQMRIMMQRIDELTKKAQDLSKKQPPPPMVAVPPGTPAGTVTPPAVAKAPASSEPKLDAFLKGFYGTLDVSFDDTTKGI